MIQFIQGQDGQLDSFVIDRKNNSGTSDYRIVDEHSGFKRWVGNNTSKDQLYTLIQTRISQAAQDVLKVHWTHKENRYTGVINQFHKSLSDQFGKDYFGYHMINMGHMLDQEAHFPYVHILRGKPDEEIEKFRSRVRGLLSAKNMEDYKTREAPQNYYLPGIEALHNHLDNTNVALEIINSPSIFNGEQIRSIANLLMPFKREREASGSALGD